MRRKRRRQETIIHLDEPKATSSFDQPNSPSFAGALPHAAHLPGTSPDGTVTYTSTDASWAGSFGAGPAPAPPPPPIAPSTPPPMYTPTPAAQPPLGATPMPRADERHAPGTAGLAATSPDGTVTYTSTDRLPSHFTLGQGPAVRADMQVPPPPPRPPSARRSTNYGSAGNRRKRGGVLGFLGGLLKFRLLLIAIGVVVSSVLWFFGFNAGTTGASRVDPGDCFEVPAEGRIDRVTDMDCSLPHEAQVFAEVTAFGSDRDLEVEEKCWDAWNELDPARRAAVPEDAHFSYLEGTLRHSCAIVSPSGQLQGSLVD